MRLVLLALLPCALLVGTRVDADFSSAVSSLWQLDSANRVSFSHHFSLGQLSGADEAETGGRLLAALTPSDPSWKSPTAEAFWKFCDKLESAPEDVGTETANLLWTLNSTEMFQRASQLFSSELAAAKEDADFLAAINRLFFSPSSLSLCRFTPESAHWLAFLRDQAKLELAEVRPVDEQSILVRLVDAAGTVRKRTVLVGTSLEFELSAIAFCTLLDGNSNSRHRTWKHCSALTDDGKQLHLAVKTALDEQGHEKLEAFFHRISSHQPSSAAEHGKKKKKKKKKQPKSSPGLQELVQQLWDKDVDRVAPGTVTLNWQKKLRKDQVEDLSPDPLFSHVDESFLQRPLYAALVDMYEQNLFQQQVCEQEPQMDSQRRAKFAKLWALITGSDVFRTAYDYLDNLNVTGHDFDQFTDHLFDFWFGTYSRCKHHGDDHSHQPLGSSGFEHVFSGEWRQSVVDGHHNWVRFYLQEKAGLINYHGYFGYQSDNVIGTFQYKWRDFLKRIGGFFFQTSPAFDFSLFTVCVLTQSGDEGCQFELLNTKMFVTSFTEPCQSQNGTCVSTTYPGIWFDTSAAPGTRQGGLLMMNLWQLSSSFTLLCPLLFFHLWTQNQAYIF